MEPFNAPSFNAPVDAQARLQSAINATAPLAGTYHGAQNGVVIPQYQASTFDSRSGVQKFVDFVGSLKDETGHLAGTAASWVGTELTHMAEAPIKFGAGLANENLDNMTLDTNSKVGQQLGDIQDKLYSDFKSGRITSDAYKKGINNLAQEFDNLVSSTKAVNDRLNLNTKDTYQAGIDTASTVLTIMTGGFGKGIDVALQAGKAIPIFEKTAADYLLSENANAFFSTIEGAVSKLGDNPELFKTLEASTQRGLTNALAETISQGGSMTAGQITRATAANIMFKYPLTFAALSGTGRDIYSQLDNKKYGDAVQNVAFNAALLLSGGPIGYALEKLGGGLKLAAKYTFGQSSFWDELGQFYKDGSKSSFADAIREATAGMDAKAKDEYIKNLSAVEATNLNAVGGNAKAAAYRLAQGMKNMYNLDLSQVTAKEELDRMVNMASAQRLADSAGEAAGLGRITVGRVDARDLGDIADRLSGVNKEMRLADWEQMKADNPTRAWANNDTFDKQVKALITQHDDPRELSQAIKDIKASFRVKGFPVEIAKKLSGMGYLPIRPVDLEAPFKEGTGQLLTKFSKGEDFFMKTVEPLPILGSMGALLVKGGLSPEGATGRVYQIFSANLRSNLEKSKALLGFKDTLVGEQIEKAATKAVKPVEQTASGFTKEELKLMEKQGITPELLAKGKVEGELTTAQRQVAVATKAPKAPAPTPDNAVDLMIKRLSNFAHNPTRGGINVHGATIRPPITDLRQLTTKDVMAALGVDARAAREVKGAIMDSMLQVPLDVRGLGDRAMDLNYKFNPISARFARIQGAFRYAWNPVFAAKLEYKTEALSQLEAQGKFPTLLGTNTILKTIMPERYKQLDAISEMLRSRGIFDERGRLEVISGEAINEVGAGSRNLTHKLLPGQERSIAGLISRQAQQAGMSVEEFINNFPHEVADTVQAIAQYDRHNGFLNSPMARTLNMAFFPFRFETKVATAVLKAASRQSPMVQFAIINGMFRARDFLNSPEGQAWYAQSADVIGLIKYFSPLSTLSTVANILGTHGTELGAYGELGGLPFGMIPQFLDSAGLTHFGTSSAFINSKTGEVLPQYVPVTDRGRLQLAIEDLIGSLYTYPGATVGLPSKSSVNRFVTYGITGGKNKADFTTKTPPLTPQERSYQQAIQAQNPQPPSPQDLASQNPMSPGTNVPSNPNAIRPLPRKTGLTSPRRKKSSFTPALLPGQSKLGQI